MSKEITPERIELINEAENLWKRGFSASEIGEKLGTSKNVIGGIINKFPDRFPARSQAFISAKLSERNWITTRKDGVKAPLNPKPTVAPVKEETTKLIKEIKALRDKGHSLGQIASNLGITKSRISGIMYRNRDLFPTVKKGSRTLPPSERKTRSEIYQDAKAKKEEAAKRAVEKLQEQVIEKAIARKAEEVIDNSLHDVFVPVELTNSAVVTTLSLKDSMCKYPIGQSKDVEGLHIYCGVPRNTDWGSSYCSTHHKLCYNPIPVRVR